MDIPQTPISANVYQQPKFASFNRTPSPFIAPPSVQNTDGYLGPHSPSIPATLFPVASLASSSPNHDGTQSPPSAVPVVSAIIIDSLANDFKLDTTQRGNLHAFVKLGSVHPPLSQADLLTRLYALAAFFRDIAERKCEAAKNEISDLKSVIADMKIHLEETFTFTGEQKANIRGVAQDVIYQPTCTSFTTMHAEVEAVLKKDQSMMKMGNVFGRPAHEKKLTLLIKKTCSSVRNAYRQDLHDSISPTKPQSLAQFTYDSALKYKRGGPGEKLDHAFIIHNVILCKFAFDNPTLLGIMEPESDTEDALDAGGLANQTTKKRKQTVGGCIAKGEDFWGQVDTYFRKEIASRGQNLAGSGWKDYVDALIHWDNRQFLDQSTDGYHPAEDTSVGDRRQPPVTFSSPQSQEFIHAAVGPHNTGGSVLQLSESSLSGMASAQGAAIFSLL